MQAYEGKRTGDEGRSDATVSAFPLRIGPLFSTLSDHCVEDAVLRNLSMGVTLHARVREQVEVKRARCVLRQDVRTGSKADLPSTWVPTAVPASLARPSPHRSLLLPAPLTSLTALSLWRQPARL